jgi:hypothetical protein
MTNYDDDDYDDIALDFTFLVVPCLFDTELTHGTRKSETETTMTFSPSRFVLPAICALLLVACGGSTTPSDGGSSDARGTGGAAGGGGRSGTGGASSGSGGASSGTGGRGTGGAVAGGTGGAGGRVGGGTGGRGTGGAVGGAGGSAGPMCASLLACCNATTNVQLRALCMTQYTTVMSMGDAACGTALTFIRGMGACP